MLLGKRSTKLNDGVGKTTEKIIPPKDYLKNKKLPEKTKFTLQYNLVNNRNPKTGDKAVGSLTRHEVHVQESSQLDLRSPRLQDGQKKLCKDLGLKQRELKPATTKLCEARKMMKTSYNSAPSINRVTATSTSVSSNKDEIMRKTAISSALNKVPAPRNSNSSITGKSKSSRQESITHKLYKTQMKSKTETKLNVSTVPMTLKIPTTNAAGMKLREPKSGALGFKKCSPVFQLPALPGGVNGASNTVCEQGTNGALDKVETRGKVNAKDRSRSRSREVNRMNSECDSAELNENCYAVEQKGKENITVSQEKGGIHKRKDVKLNTTGEEVTTAKATRNVCSDVVGMNKVAVDCSGKAEDFVGNVARCTSQVMWKGEVNWKQNHVLHVHNAEVIVTGEELAEDESKLKETANRTINDKLSEPEARGQDMGAMEFSSVLPIQNYDSYESLERRNHEDELMNLDRTIWSDLKVEIRETCDDSGDSLSDIIHHLWVPEEEQEVEVEKYEREIKREVNANEQEKFKIVDGECDWSVHAGDALEERHEHSQDMTLNAEAKFTQENAKEKKAARQEDRLKESVENSNLTNISEEAEIKRKVGESKKRNSLKDTREVTYGERKRTHTQEIAKLRGLTEESVCSGFFRTHKNVGFIGKDVDEEFVSFEVGQVTLYQPHESQMLFYDIANCTAAQAYLKMCGITFDLEKRKNAEDMSPSGKVPFISSGLCIIPEFEAIVSFMQFKKFACIRIEERDKPTFRSLISMIADTLETAERYICWYDDATVTKYTKPRVGGHYPFPLNHIIYWKKGFEERKLLADSGMEDKTFDLVLREINFCFRTLSQHLGNNNFFFGNVSTEIDALIYGHIYALFTADVEGPFKDVQFMMQQFPNLIAFATNFDKVFSLHKFSDIDLSYWDNLLINSKGVSKNKFAINL